VTTTYIQCPCLIALLYNNTVTKSLFNLLPQRRKRLRISAINPGTSFETTAQSTASLISISAPSNCLSAFVRSPYPSCLFPPLFSSFSERRRRRNENEMEKEGERLTLASTNLRDNGSYSNNKVIGLLDGISYSS